jgi:hypothetical protein
VVQLVDPGLLLALGRDHARDVDQGEDRPVGRLVPVEVGESAHQVVDPALAAGDPALDRTLARQHGPDVLVQPGVVELARDVGERPAAVGRDEVETPQPPPA